MQKGQIVNRLGNISFDNRLSVSDEQRRVQNVRTNKRAPNNYDIIRRWNDYAKSCPLRMTLLSAPQHHTAHHFYTQEKSGRYIKEACLIQAISWLSGRYRAVSAYNGWINQSSPTWKKRMKLVRLQRCQHSYFLPVLQIRKEG